MLTHKNSISNSVGDDEGVDSQIYKSLNTLEKKLENYNDVMSKREYIHAILEFTNDRYQINWLLYDLQQEFRIPKRASVIYQIQKNIYNIIWMRLDTMLQVINNKLMR